MPRVLIIGCGFVGEAAADLFHARGWPVAAWTHAAESAARLGAVKPYPVEARDITDPATFLPPSASPLPPSPDVLVDCVSSGRGGGAEQYRRVYLEGARHLRAAFPEARFLYTGSTSVYAQTGGDWVDEDSPAEPARETGRVLCETEATVLAAPAGGTVARLAGIYGPGRSALLRKFLVGESVIEGDGGRWINQIHRDDAALALWHLAQPDASPGIYNVADDTPLTQLELHRALADAAGRPLPPFGAVDTQRKRGVTSKRVSNARLRALGWQPSFPSFLDWAAEELAKA